MQYKIALIKFSLSKTNILSLKRLFYPIDKLYAFIIYIFLVWVGEIWVQK